MFFYWGADAARDNVNRYKRKLDRAELKFIIKSIENASRQGFTDLRWRGMIRDSNLRALKRLGYKIHQTTYRIYEIEW